jgi:hypothetical protein
MSKVFVDNQGFISEIEYLKKDIAWGEKEASAWIGVSDWLANKILTTVQDNKNLLQKLLNESSN